MRIRNADIPPEGLVITESGVYYLAEDIMYNPLPAASDLDALDGGNFEDAKRRFDAALSIKPDYDVALYGLGLTEVRQGRPDLAVASFSRYIEIKKDGPYYEKAKAFIRQHSGPQ